MWLRGAMLSSACVVACVAGASPARADEPRTHYALTADLNTSTHVVHGTARIHWVNESREPASNLYFHLYLNGFRDDETVFMRESRGSLREVEASGHGHIDVTSLATSDGTNLLSAAHTDLVSNDKSQMRVDLATPVAPGAAIDLVIVFDSTLPPVFARTGYADDFHMVAQWFPKLAVREVDGAWSTFPFHGMGEFYSDFADYELTLTVPDGWAVGASGRQISEARAAGKTTRRFRAARVHDVAWTAWPHFREERFDVDGVEVRMLFPHGYEGAIAAHSEATRRGLRHFGRMFGAYPYETLTVVVPPRNALGAAGMEYPTLIVSQGMWFNMPGIHYPYPEYVTAHELAHEWFYGLVASNEVQWPFLDEGLTEWAGADLIRTMYGESANAVTFGSTTLSIFELSRAAALWPHPPSVPPARPAYAFSSSRVYGASVYALTATLLETIKRVWGRARFEQALGTYARAQAFRHPAPDDLFKAFDDAYFAGFSDRYLKPTLFDSSVASTRITGMYCRAHGDGYRTEVEVVRDGNVALPLWIALYGKRGEVVARVPWTSTERRLRATYETNVEIYAAEIDPDHHNLLDENTLDNARSTIPESARPVAARLLYLFQSMFRWVVA